MPATPYAKVLVSINGGANTSGGIDVPSACTAQFSAESTVGWRQQRWELYEYPEGFTAPAGWSTAADGTIFSTDVTPTLVTLPANTVRWGPWSSRLKINEAVDDDATKVPNLVDEATILQMLSPNGLRDIPALSSSQFCTATTMHKAWVRDYQRTLRTLEALLGSGPITDASVAWEPTASPNSKAKSYQEDGATADATPTTILTIPIVDETAIDVTATVIGRGDASEYFRLDLRGGWYRTDGTVTETDAPSTADAPSAGNPAGWAAVLELSGTNVIVKVTGAAAKAINWSVVAEVQSVTKDASPSGGPFDPATLNLTGWWRASYGGSPWAPTASAGTSGANGNLAEATNPPTVGAAQNALDPADFDGADDLIASPNAMSTFVSAGAGSIAVLFNADTAAAPGAGVYDDEPLVCDSTANIAMGFSTSGVRAGIYDTGATWKETAPVACATGGWHLAQMRWDGVNLEVRVDSGAWTPVACANMATLTGLLQFGKNYNVSFLDGRILDIITAATKLSDGDFDNLITYVNDRYALVL